MGSRAAAWIGGWVVLVALAGCGSGGPDDTQDPTHAICQNMDDNPESCLVAQLSPPDFCEAEFINADFIGCVPETQAWLDCLDANSPPAGQELDCPDCEAETTAVGDCFEPG